MKKSVITHIVVMIIAVALGWYLASSLTVQRADIIKIEKQISKAPLGGFNKFASDVQWMLFINYCGGLDAVKAENVEEIYKRLNGILNNDPNHEAAYEMGGMMFSVRAPQKAVEIFTRGAENPNLKDNWRLPFYAGFVLTQHMKDSDDDKRLQKAEKMFRMALERNNSLPHILSALIRTRAKQLMKRGNWKGVPIANDKHAYLCALYDEWRQGGGTGGEVFSGNAVGVSTDLRPMLLVAAQKAKASAPNDKNILNTIDKVMDKVLKAEHLCAKCLNSYAPGDRFCGACGNRVVVYGTCPVCGNIMKAKYCSRCGCDDARAKEIINKRLERRRARMARPAVAAPVVKPAVAVPVKPAVKPAVTAPAAK
ncbi:MAG: zinc ribbon domain-containing protein [Victivallaceae bacterium]|nr:zinc ribbon domain-containing protein [Victivallaceae bacterium]